MRSRRNLSIDRLSDLPDSILCHILSFLPTTKISLRTSLLGRRWRYLWSYVPNLIFNYDNQDTINRVLFLYKLQTINTFRLTVEIGCDKDDLVGKWVTFAVGRSVQNIDICVDYHAHLPPGLFTCKTLVDLSIESFGAIPIVGNVMCLPRLKRLHLMYVKYEGNESLPHLLSGCPALEELLIHSNTDYESFKISSPTIKRLFIDLHYDGDDSDNEEDCCNYKLEIETPALVYLHLADDSAKHIECGALNSLIKADIDIKAYINDFIYARSVVELFDRLRNVKCLKLQLSCYTKTIQSAFSARTTSFRNLVKLELASDCPFLLKFLEDADNLEILILHEVPRHKEIKSWMEPQQVPACLLSRLRTTKLVGIKGKKHELEVIRYLLRNAKVLEKMEVVYYCSLNPYEKIDMLQNISAFQRGSSVCEVRFV